MPTELNPRQVQVLQLAKEQGFVTIEALSERLGVTMQTVRRDINLLCEEGLLSRFHGGAAYRSSVTNLPYETRRGALAREKDLIAQAVAAEIADDSSVFIDIGTSAEAVATRLLDKRKLKIVTNNLNVVRILAGKEDFEIVVPCGSIRHRDLAIVGEAATDSIERFQLDYAVLGVVAIAADGHILDFSIDDTRLTRAILRCGRQSFVVADHSKFGRHAMARVAHLSDATALFTDSLPGGGWSDMLSEAGIRVVVTAATRPSHARR